MVVPLIGGLLTWAATSIAGWVDANLLGKDTRGDVPEYHDRESDLERERREKREEEQRRAPARRKAKKKKAARRRARNRYR